MKKLLIALLTATMVITAPACIFAETPNEQELTTDAAADLEGTIKLEATIVSQYKLKFPLKVDVKEEETTVDIYACGDVDGSKTIVISKKNDSNALVNTDKSLSEDVSVSFGEGISGLDIEEDYGDAKETMTLSHDALVAGYWSYDLPILIKLV